MSDLNYEATFAHNRRGPYPVHDRWEIGGLKNEKATDAPEETPSEKTKREEILDEAKRLIISDRQDQYGPPVQNFKNIADLWNIRFQRKLKEPLTASDVAVAMLLLKIARDVHGYKEDSAVDSAAYAALYAEIETALQKESKS